MGGPTGGWRLSDGRPNGSLEGSIMSVVVSEQQTFKFNLELTLLLLLLVVVLHRTHTRNTAAQRSPLAASC